MSSIQAESALENMKRHPMVYLWFAVTILSMVILTTASIRELYKEANPPVVYQQSSIDESVKYLDPEDPAPFEVRVSAVVERNRYCPAEYRVFWTHQDGSPALILPPIPGGWTPVGTSKPSMLIPVPKIVGVFNINAHVISWCPEKTYITNIPGLKLEVVELKSTEPTK